MITSDELSLLARFDTGGRLALSLYLDVSTPEKRANAVDRIGRQMSAATPAGADDGSLAPLAEDLEMVRLYLGTTTARRLDHVAIFSCAAQLFWRVYPLDLPMAEQVTVSTAFDVIPLARLLDAVPVDQRADAYEPDLLPQA